METAHNYKLYLETEANKFAFVCPITLNFPFKGSWKLPEVGQKHAFNYSLISFVTICHVTYAVTGYAVFDSMRAVISFSISQLSNTI